MGDKAVPDLDIWAALVAPLLMAGVCAAPALVSDPSKRGALGFVVLVRLVWLRSDSFPGLQSAGNG
jgi:hypothetical protein